jgi:hypothetical protein
MSVEIGEVLRGIVEMSLPGDTIAQMVFHWIAQGINPMSEAAILTALASWADDLMANVEDYVRSTATLDTISVYTIEWNEGDEKWVLDRYIGEAALSDNFAGAVDMLPHQIAAVVTATTDDVRRYGRKFIPAFDESSGGTGDIGEGLLADLADWALDYLLTVTVAGADSLAPGVPGGKTKLGIGDGVFHEFVLARVPSVFATQRRRRKGVGV